MAYRITIDVLRWENSNSLSREGVIAGWRCPPKRRDTSTRHFSYGKTRKPVPSALF